MAIEEILKSGKISPEVVQTILTDDMVRRLAAIQNHLEKSVPIHYLASKTVSVTDVPTEVNLGEWVNATLFNNTGGSNVYVYNARQLADSRDAYLAAGDSLPLDRKERTTDRFYLVCASTGTATVRIFYQ